MSVVDAYSRGSICGVTVIVIGSWRAGVDIHADWKGSVFETNVLTFLSFSKKSAKIQLSAHQQRRMLRLQHVDSSFLSALFLLRSRFGLLLLVGHIQANALHIASNVIHHLERQLEFNRMLGSLRSPASSFGVTRLVDVMNAEAAGAFERRRMQQEKGWRTLQKRMQQGRGWRMLQKRIQQARRWGMLHLIP